MYLRWQIAFADDLNMFSCNHQGLQAQAAMGSAFTVFGLRIAGHKLRLRVFARRPDVRTNKY